MLARFEGLCWICRAKPAVALDHCHASGRPRGALCDGCNTDLGKAERNGWIDAARAYLDEAKEVTHR